MQHSFQIKHGVVSDVSATQDITARNLHPYGQLIAALEYRAGTPSGRSGFAAMNESDRATYLRSISISSVASPRGDEGVSRSVLSFGPPHPPAGYCGGYRDHDAYLSAMYKAADEMKAIHEFAGIAATNTRTMAQLSCASTETMRVSCTRCVYAHVYIAESLSKARVLFFPPSDHRCFDVQCISRRELWSRVRSSEHGEVVTTSMYNTAAGVHVNPPVRTSDIRSGSHLDSSTVALIDAVAKMMRGEMVPGGGFEPLNGCDPIDAVTKIARGISLKVYNAVVYQMCMPFHGFITQVPATADTDLSRHVPVRSASDAPPLYDPAGIVSTTLQFFTPCTNPSSINHIASLLSRSPMVYCVVRCDSRPQECLVGTFLTGVVVFSSPTSSNVIRDVFPGSIVVSPLGDVNAIISWYKSTDGFVEYHARSPEQSVWSARNVVPRVSESQVPAAPPTPVQPLVTGTPRVGRKRMASEPTLTFPPPIATRPVTTRASAAAEVRRSRRLKK